MTFKSTHQGPKKKTRTNDPKFTINLQQKTSTSTHKETQEQTQHAAVEFNIGQTDPNGSATQTSRKKTRQRLIRKSFQKVVLVSFFLDLGCVVPFSVVLRQEIGLEEGVEENK